MRVKKAFQSDLAMCLRYDVIGRLKLGQGLCLLAMATMDFANGGMDPTLTNPMSPKPASFKSVVNVGIDQNLCGRVPIGHRKARPSVQ